MLETAHFAVIAGLVLVAGALVLHSREAWAASRRIVTRHAVTVGARGEAPTAEAWPDRRTPSDGASATLGVLAAVALTIGLLARAVAVGHGPFSNQYEFAVAFAWGVVVAAVVARRHLAMPAVSLAVLPVALAMLLYATTLDSGDRGLVPALQNRWLLTAHVLAAVLAYGAAAISCGAAVLELVHLRRGADAQRVDRLDEVAHRAVVIAYPLLTAMLVLGAVWADRAWGTYWSWDPKETSALMTWLIYGGYLHARVVKGWRGRRAAWLLVLGFAAVLFTYFGNLFFGGLHSYA